MFVVVWVAALIALAVLGAVAASRRARKAEEAQQRAQHGDQVVIKCLLRGAAPYPARSRSGRLTISANRLIWQPLLGWGRTFDLASRGVAVRGIRLKEQSGFPYGSLAVYPCYDGTGANLELAIPVENVDLLSSTLQRLGHSASVREERSPRWHAFAGFVSPWAAFFLLLWLAVGGFFTYIGVAGQMVDATVTKVGTDSCHAAWADPWDGRPQSAELDCPSNATVGQQMRAFAHPFPFRGNADDPGTDEGIAVLVGAVLLLPVLIDAGLEVRARRRRRALQSEPHETPTSWDGLPLATVADVSWRRLADLMEDRAEIEGWGRDETLSGNGPKLTPSPAKPARFWWQVKALRFPARSVVLTSLPVLIFGTLGVVFGFGWWTSSLWLATGPTDRTMATVSSLDSGDSLPFMPRSLGVTLTTASGKSKASVAWSGSQPKVGDQVEVVFATRHPGHARAVDHDGLVRGALLCGALTAACFGFVGVRCVRTNRALRVIFRAADSPQRSDMRYLLMPNADGTPLLLLFNDYDEAEPRLGNVCAQNPIGVLPVAGRASVAGEATPGQIIVPRVDQYTLWPLGEAVAVDRELVVDLVNAGRDPDA